MQQFDFKQRTFFHGFISVKYIKMISISFYMSTGAMIFYVFIMFVICRQVVLFQG
jgi:hypothetical protein